jgi:hypothetical protein
MFHQGVGGSEFCDQHDLWYEPESIQYREITGYPHLNPCVNSLEILNIGMGLHCTALHCTLHSALCTLHHPYQMSEYLEKYCIGHSLSVHTYSSEEANLYPAIRV